MSIQELLNSQVSTRFILSMSALAGTFAYGWIGPLSHQGGTAADVLGTVYKIVAIYVLGKVAKDVTEAVRR